MPKTPDHLRSADLSTFRAIFDVYRRMKDDQARRGITFSVTSEPQRVAWNGMVTLWACATMPGRTVVPVVFPRGQRRNMMDIEYTASMGCGFVFAAGPVKYVFLQSKLIF